MMNGVAWHPALARGAWCWRLGLAHLDALGKPSG